MDDFGFTKAQKKMILETRAGLLDGLLQCTKDGVIKKEFLEFYLQKTEKELEQLNES